MYLLCVCFGRKTDEKEDKQSPSARPSQNGQLRCSEGEDNEGFESSEPSATITSNGYYSQNLNTVINGGDEKQLKLIPVGEVNVEKADREEDAIQTKAKSRTPSPKSSMDEIMTVSELSDLVTEKVEPNGKAYFVEDINEKNSDSIEESSKAIAILDDILNDEEKIMDNMYPSLDDESLASPVFREQSVVADIHREDEISMPPVDVSLAEPIQEEQESSQETEPETSAPSSLAVEEAPPIRPRAAFVVGQDAKSPLNSDEEDVHYNRLDSQKQKQFMTRLSTLLVKPQQLPYKRKSRKSTSEDTSETSELPRSNSEPSFILLLDNSETNESGTDSPERSPKEGVPPPPTFDEALFNTIKPESELEKAKTPIPETPVPTPPKFDPILYNTLGRDKAARPSILSSPITTTGYSEVTLRKLHPQSTPPAVDSKNPDEAEEDSSDNPREAFKSKLEKLLSQGPATKIRPKTLPALPLDRQASTTVSQTPTQSSSTAEVPAPSATNGEPQPTTPSNFRELAKNFDTAKKQQKLIFDDVLKAINPDTRPSSIRNSLEHRMSFSEFKNGLKKTVPPKQYLPDA